MIFFSFSTLNVFLFFLASIISVRKSVICLTVPFVGSKYVLLSLAAFKILSLYFRVSIVMYLIVASFVYILAVYWGSLSFNGGADMSHQFWKFLDYYLLKYCFCPTRFHSYPSGTLIKHTFDYLAIFYMSLLLSFIHPILLSLCLIFGYFLFICPQVH